MAGGRARFGPIKDREGNGEQSSALAGTQHHGPIDPGVIAGRDPQRPDGRLRTGTVRYILGIGSGSGLGYILGIY